MLPNTEPPEDVSQATYLSLRREISGCVFRHVKGFYAKFFDGRSWTTAAEKVVQKVQPTVNRGLCADFLRISSQESLSAWFDGFQSILAEEGICYQYRTGPSSDPDDPLRANIYLTASDEPKPNSPSTAANARVFGEFNANAAGTGPGEVLRFCESVRQVFAAQPIRRFLHVFQIHSSIMELWVFDRSGAYSCERLELDQRPDLLIKTIAGYMMMNDEEVGFNGFTRLDGQRHNVSFSGRAGTEVERFYLEDMPIAAPQYIVGPGTTCYSASTAMSRNPEYVVKFAWREDERHTERELLELTKNRNVSGVISIVGCQDLESTGSLREGLQFGRPYDFAPAATNQSIVHTPDEPATFVNRTFSCLTTYPLGRSINRFESLSEFLEACRDIVRALKSLYQDGKILHRDICIKNLIIVPQHQKGDAKGFLIDLDGALDLEKGPARTGELVGSEGFMAIGILSQDPHTYRHDLESLLYVFLWIAICNDHEHDDAESLRYQPKTSRLWGWCSMNFRAVALHKIDDMSRDGFTRILNEFSNDFEHLKELAKELRELLFPIRDGEIFTGTDMNQDCVNKLYDGMIDAFNRSINLQTHKDSCK